MSQSNTVTVSGSVALNNATVSAAANIALTVLGTGNLLDISTNNVTLSAAPGAAGAVATDNMVFSGNNGIITDEAFNHGNVTISGSHDLMGSPQDIETMNLVVSGDNDTVSSVYQTGSVLVSGSNCTIEVAGAAVTITGANDTVISANAPSIVVTGAGDSVVNEMQIGQAFPFNLLFAPGAGGNAAVSTAISVSGANANIVSYNNNDSITASGNNDTVSALSYNNTISASGGGTVINTAPINESVTVAGANSTVNTSFLPGVTSTLPGATVSFVGAGTLGAAYNNGARTVNDSVGASAPVSVNITNGDTTVYAGNNYNYTDTVGGNQINMTTGAHVSIAAGNDTVTMASNSFVPTQATVTGGTAAAPNTVVLSGGDYYVGGEDTATGSYTVLNTNSNNNSGVIYADSNDTLSASGNNNFFTLENLPAASSTSGSSNTISGSYAATGTTTTISGDSTLNIFTNNNTVAASNGAHVYISASSNVVNGDDITLFLLGTNNTVMLSGTSTVTDGSPFQYASMAANGVTQNMFTVQGGSFNLGGLDQLDQTSGTAAVSLYGGNAVTLAGAGDAVTVNDQIYGANTIVDNGTGTTYTIDGASGSKTDIVAANAVTVRAIDFTSAGAVIGQANTNTNETLSFIARSGNDLVNALGSNLAVTFVGGAGSNDTVYGGAAGGNSLSGGTGAGDYFVAGGNGDVLTGGTGGANTLVSGAGSETLTGASLGTDLFSITGGGSSLTINGTAGRVELAGGLSVTSETATGGGLLMVLNDGTQINFTGIASLNQTGAGSFTL